jgi:hypothetical protein
MIVQGYNVPTQQKSEMLELEDFLVAYVTTEGRNVLRGCGHTLRHDVGVNNIFHETSHLLTQYSNLSNACRMQTTRFAAAVAGMFERVRASFRCHAVMVRMVRSGGVYVRRESRVWSQAVLFCVVLFRRDLSSVTREYVSHLI